MLVNQRLRHVAFNFPGIVRISTEIPSRNYSPVDVLQITQFLEIASADGIGVLIGEQESVAELLHALQVRNKDDNLLHRSSSHSLIARLML